MFSLASGSNVQISLVTQNSGSLHGSVLVVRGKFLQAVERLLIDQETLLDPALDSAGGAHPREALLALQHLDALSVFHAAHTVVDGRNLVAQRRLGR